MIYETPNKPKVLINNQNEEFEIYELSNFEQLSYDKHLPDVE